MLRQFVNTFVDRENLSLLGKYENCLFYNCSVKDLSNVSLINCVLNKSRLLIQDINKLRNFNVTMNCGSFKGVQLSELIFDLILMLLISSAGNDTKRRKLVALLGKDRVKQLSKDMEGIEIGS